MIPRSKLLRGGAHSFPYVGIATAVLLVYAIVVATVPPNPYRTALAIVSFFAMGYCLLALVVGGTMRLSAAEILGFSAGLTILITSLSALGVSIIGIPISEFSVIIVGLPIGLLAFFLRRPHGGTWSSFANSVRGTINFSDYSRLEKGVAIALLVAIVGALLVLLSLSGAHTADRLSPGLALDGPDGTPGSLPSSFVLGQPQGIVVTAFGGENASTFVLRIRLVPNNATGNETFHPVSQTSPLRMDAFSEYRTTFSLIPGGKWTQPFSVSIEVAGTFGLQFDLLDSTGAVLARSRLPVVAS